MNFPGHPKANRAPRNAASHSLRRWHSLLLPGTDQANGNRRALIFAVLLLVAITIWSYGPTIASLARAWQRNEDYSACLIVPLIAAFLVWRERRAIEQCPLVPSWWGGIALLLLAEVGGIYLFLAGGQPSLERYLVVFAVAGLVLLIGGWSLFGRVLGILLFLFLMVPLPGRVHNLISLPLQSIATAGAVFLLEAFGTSVSQHGNVVVLDSSTPLEVAEACSGLRMLIAFVIAAALIAYLVKRPRWQKAILLVSSIPVAVICNVIRIFVTAMLMLYVGSEVGQKFFHDIGGFVMIAIAVSLLFGEIRLMDRLIVSESSPQPGQVIISACSAEEG